MNAERKNYFFRLGNPIFLAKAIYWFSISATWAILRRTMPALIRFMAMPGEVRRLRRIVLAERHSWPAYPAKSQGVTRVLQLPGIEFRYNDETNWEEDFLDIEIAVYLHRWNWLLIPDSSSGEPIPPGIAISIIRSWLQKFSQENPIHADAYSGAERIANVILFFQQIHQTEVPPDLVSALRYMAQKIAQNLEYHEANLTGNHALNNARGLLYAGAVSGSKGFITLANAIIRERLPVLVTQDGFLREGSSHYHFLFARWILEMHLLCMRNRLGDLADFLKPYAIALVKACWFYLVYDEADKSWSYPLIGDISPDCTPEWLLKLPWSEPALAVYEPPTLPANHEQEGWSHLFGVKPGKAKLIPGKSHIYPKSGWHRIEFEELSLFIYAPGKSGHDLANHEHMDLGGFVLYRSGRILITDPGRRDYTLSSVSRYGKGPYAHNTLTLDGLPPTGDYKSWMQIDYKSVTVRTEVRNLTGSTEFILEHSGFYRIAGSSVKHIRTFTLHKYGFRVTDKLVGVKSKNIQIRFHFRSTDIVRHNNNRDWVSTSHGAIFRPDERLRTRAIVNQCSEPYGGIQSLRYGEIKPCTTFHLEAKMELPAEINNELVLT